MPALDADAELGLDLDFLGGFGPWSQTYNCRRVTEEDIRPHAARRSSPVGRIALAIATPTPTMTVTAPGSGSEGPPSRSSRPKSLSEQLEKDDGCRLGRQAGKA
jgi:hypothetical protein